MNDAEKKREAVIADLGLGVPRVTTEMVKEILETVTYEARMVQGSSQAVATAIMPGGFVLATASAGPAVFNPALAIEMAIAKARGLAWVAVREHESYRLSQAIYESTQDKATAALQQIRAVLSRPTEQASDSQDAGASA